MAYISAALKNLTDLTDKKIEHLKDILDITYKQKEVIEKQNVDMLTKYIKEKQRHIDTINELDEEFQKIYESIKGKLQTDGINQASTMSTEESELYRDFKIKVQTAHNIVKIIFKMEKENNEKAKQMMVYFKEKIRAINNGQKGYKAYKSFSTITDGVYLDKKR